MQPTALISEVRLRQLAPGGPPTQRLQMVSPPRPGRHVGSIPSKQLAKLSFPFNTEVTFLVLFIFLVTLTLPPAVPLYITAFFFPSLVNTRTVHFPQKNLFWVHPSQLLPWSRALVGQVGASPKREQWEMVKKGHSSSQPTAWPWKNNFHLKSPS